MADKNIYIKLNNGLKIPQLGFGTCHLLPNEECTKACIEAIKIGYRLIDTAHKYGNERGVGEAIKQSKINREEIFITSKIWPTHFGTKKTEETVNGILKRMNLNYIDLILLHWPFGNYIEAYKDLEKCVKDGKIKSIGLSNFYEKELKEILNIATIKPVIDQVECHPYRNQNELRKLLLENNILLESWYPLARCNETLMNNENLKNMGKNHNKSVVQIILRWHLQKGNVTIPKTSHVERMKENYDIFDFELSNNEMEQIENIPPKIIWDPNLKGSFEKFIEWAMNTPPEDN